MKKRGGLLVVSLLVVFLSLSFISALCVDSDNENGFDESLFIRGNVLENDVSYNDACFYESEVAEQYCGVYIGWDFWNTFGGKVAKTGYRVCENGCFNGACVGNIYVSGNTNPDVSGTYVFKGENFFEREDGEYTLWYSASAGFWYLSESYGNVENSWINPLWARDDVVPAIEQVSGLYVIGDSDSD